MLIVYISIKSPFHIKMLLNDFERCDGYRKNGKVKKWESKEQVKERVFKVFDKYKQYDKVIVSGHAMMIGYVTDDIRAYDYCEIKKFFYGS